MSIGYQGHMGLKQETVFGEEAGPPEVFGAIYNESIVMDNKLIRPETVNGSRFRKLTLPGPVSAGGGLSMPLEAEGMTPWLLKGLFGSVASDEIAEGVYEHTFSPVNSSRLPSFTAQVDHEASCQNWIGCTIGGATISVTSGGLLNFNVDMLAQRPRKCERIEPVYPDIIPWTAYEACFTLNGVENVMFEDFKLEFSNNVEAVWTLNGKRHAAKHVAKGFELEGRITLEYSTEAERRRMWGNPSAVEPQLVLEPGSLKLALTQALDFAGDNHRTLTVDVPEIYYATAPANLTGAKERIMQTVTFFANYCRSASKFADVVLRNGEPGYADPD